MLKILAVTVAFVSIVAVCVGTEGEGKAVLTRDYGVKLCGREFIRAVIFTCGGSRWRRMEEGGSLQSGERDPFLINSYSGLSESSRLHWLQTKLAATEHPQKPLSSLVDLLKALGDFSDHESGAELDQGETPQWESGESAWQQWLPMMRGAKPQIPWPRPNKQKRNFSLGLAGMCCNQGCTKNDIGRLC